jgi:glycerol-3-phosphate dehydrogenase
MVEADRLTLAFAAAADRAGADLANYVEALTPLRDRDRISGMTVRDAFSGDVLSINARATVNAAGARAGAVMRAFGVSRTLPLLKAMNLVTSKPASDIALAAPTSRGRMLTLVPWRGRAIVGTGQSETLVQPDAGAVTASEVDAFIAEANEAFPSLRLTRDDVTLVHRGIVPAREGGAHGAPTLLATPIVYDHAADGVAGAMTVAGVKYTTARRVAQQVTERVAKRLGKRLPPSRTATTVLPGAGIADHEALAIETARACSLELPMATIRHLIALYAERAADIVRLMKERPDLRDPVAPTAATLGAEVVHVIRHEMAVRLSDVVIRRTGLGAAGQPDDAALRRCAEIAGRELEWDATCTQDEIAAVNAFYAIADV